MTCCKLPPIWWWRLRTFLGGFGRNYPLFFCEHAIYGLQRDEGGWFWKQLHEDEPPDPWGGANLAQCGDPDCRCAGGDDRG